MNFPELAFGLYKVTREECEEVVRNAISVGYRHFDCAPIYGNEKEVGLAIKKELDLGHAIKKREDLIICSKVWKTSVQAGRKAVRQSILQSIEDLCSSSSSSSSDGSEKDGYLDVAMIHWPTIHHTEAYKELELMVHEGKIRAIGLSNYHEKDYEELIAAGITIKPIINQMQVSPFMYRPKIINYFTENLRIRIASHKSLNRGDFGGDRNNDKEDSSLVDNNEKNNILQKLAKKYTKSSAQIMIKWGVQKNFIVVFKTSSLERMKENMDIFDFSLEDEDIINIDALTKEEDIIARYEHEMASRK